MNLKSMRARIEVLNLADRFFESSILIALVKLKIFEAIGSDDKHLAEIAAVIGARPETLERLLNAGALLNLLERPGDRLYRVSPMSQAVLLPSAGEAYLGDWIRNSAHFNDSLTRLDEAVSNSAPTVNPQTHLGVDQAQTREFMLAMHNYAATSGRELAHYLDTGGCRSVLDLGCGPGTYAFQLGLQNPELRLYLLDFAPVLEVAKDLACKYPLKNEIFYLAADALVDEIPGRYDLILISNALHQLGYETSAKLIKRLYGSVNPGGSVVIQARFLQDDGLGDKVAIFLDLLELCITDAGRNHSVAETSRWLADAGFVDICHCKMSLFNVNSFLRGYKKGHG